MAQAEPVTWKTVLTVLLGMTPSALGINIGCFWESHPPNLRFAQSPTSGHLLLSLTDISRSSPSTPPRQLDPINPAGIIHHVRSLPRQLHRQAPLPQALDDAHCPVVHRCLWLQETRLEVGDSLTFLGGSPGPTSATTNQWKRQWIDFNCGGYIYINILHLAIHIMFLPSPAGPGITNQPIPIPPLQPSTNNQTRADDLIPEENDVVQKALKRLPPKEAYDRVFRIRRAFQVRPIPKPTTK